MINNIAGRKVLITGVTGFVGNWLGVWLHLLGAEVYGLARKSMGKQQMFNITRSETFIELIETDITDFQNVCTAIHKIKPEIVFHIAALSSSKNASEDPFQTFDCNVMGTINVLEALKQMDNKCNLLFVNSDRCYKVKSQGHIYLESDPLGGDDPYSASKAAAEVALTSYFRSFFNKIDSKIRIGSVRPNNVIGGGDFTPGRILPDCVGSWQIGVPVQLMTPGEHRPWQHVLDMLYGILLLANDLQVSPRYNGHSYNLGPPNHHFISMRDMVIKFGSYWQDLGLPQLYTSPEVSSLIVTSNVKALNCEKAYLELGWQSILPMDKTLEWTAEWYQHFQKRRDMLEVTRKQIRSYEELIN